MAPPTVARGHHGCEAIQTLFQGLDAVEEGALNAGDLALNLLRPHDHAVDKLAELLPEREQPLLDCCLQRARRDFLLRPSLQLRLLLWRGRATAPGRCCAGLAGRSGDAHRPLWNVPCHWLLNGGARNRLLSPRRRGGSAVGPRCRGQGRRGADGGQRAPGSHWPGGGKAAWSVGPRDGARRGARARASGRQRNCAHGCRCGGAGLLR
mmetsp:Transcript_34193/g.102065  ORF Transcript_34193/g.102065 Transcript_34193/m.102065 type:complete len:208 (+) Transcript_34193:299-922(+)